MERKVITPEQQALLRKPLPSAAISKHPTKTYLSSIKAIYVTERLNEVFGIGAWKFQSSFVEKIEGMIVVYATLSIPEYGVELSSYGGNDNGGEKNKNFDLGDAYKGASTDALTKICSWLEIGIDVFKGLGNAPAPKATEVKPIQKTPPPVVIPEGLLEEISKAVDRASLLEIWEGNKALHTVPEFTGAITRAKEKLPEVTHPMQNPNAVPIDLKTKILLLLGDETSVFTADEKQKMIDAIKRRDSENEPGKARLWAETVITKLKGQIHQRTQTAA